MANFPVYHGITLAQNAFIENLHVERLDSDPVPVTAGRVWYNTTDKVFKQSTLDGTGAVVVRTYATVEDLAAAISTLQAAIAAEATARQAADATLQANIDAEATARQAADAAEVTARTAAIEAEVTARTAAIAAEATARQAADDAEVTARNAAIAAEASLRAAADTTLQANIDALRTNVVALGNAFNYVGVLIGGADVANATDLSALPAGEKDAGDYYKVSVAGYFKVGETTPIYANIGDGLVFNISGGIDKIDNTDSNVQGTTNFINVTGSADTGFTVDIDSAFKARVTAVETGLASEVTARQAADDAEVTARQAADAAEATARQAADEAEITARQAADATLQANIDAEATARQAADATLQANIDAEVTARQAADATLQANIAAEASARQAADTGLQNQIGDLASLNTTATGTLVDAINEVKTAAGGGTSAIINQYNSSIFTYESPTAASTHTIAHNLGNTFVDFSVLIQRADGKWYNDIASIEATDGNNATLYLSTAQKIRVIARSATTLS